MYPHSYPHLITLALFTDRDILIVTLQNFKELVVSVNIFESQHEAHCCSL